MKRLGISEPPHVTYLSTDLSQVRLDELALPAPATWNWLGVTMYLEKSATAQALHDIASRQHGTVLVVNFLLEEFERSELGNEVQSEASALLRVVREPVLASYTVKEIEALMIDSGFSSTAVLEASDLTERYLNGRNDLILPSSTVIAVAMV